MGDQTRETWSRERILTALRNSPGLGRLTAIRLAGQFGDGMFQAALSGAILFNPEREADPVAIAAGFTVLLLPYSVLGPFAGALLDRWDRRLVLLLANALRGSLIVLTAALLAGGLNEGPLLLLALAVVGVSRFVLSGVSASLPHVVRQSWLVPMNSVLATVASGCAGVGAGAAVAAIAWVGEGDAGSATAVALSAVGSVVSVVAATGFARGALGPAEQTDRPRRWDAVVAVATGLREGATAVWRTPVVTTAMIGICAHRIVFGINTLIMVLILRDNTTDDSLAGGLVGFGVAIAATAAGMLFAALVAPFLIPRLGRPRTITASLVFATLVQVGLIATLAHGWLLIGAFLLGLAGQTIKLTGDATMQIDIADSVRGRVFALQDTVFNIAFVLALTLAALAVPADGKSLAVVLVGAGIYVLGLVAVALNSRRHAGPDTAVR